MSEQTDTIEAVARGWAESIAQHLCHPADQDAAIRLVADALVRFERDRIAAHTKALVDGAVEVGKRLAQQMCNRRGEELCGCHLCAALVQAAATIAALRAENEQLLRLHDGLQDVAQGLREEGVRAGIEAAAGAALNCALYDSNEQLLNSDPRATCSQAARALDAAAIAKGV